MTAKHTPGPWHKSGLPHHAEGLVVVAQNGYCIGKVWDTNGWPENLANLALICAAPDLLAALEPFAAFLDALEAMGGNTVKSGEWYALESLVSGRRVLTVEDFNAARAAIAKATGQ